MSLNVSPGVSAGALRAQYSSASEFRARKLFNSSLSAFTSNLLDVADMTPLMRERIQQFRALVLQQAPDMAEWNTVMEKQENGQ